MIGDALRRLTAPEPSPELWQRILRSRAAGVRIVLPGEDAERRIGWMVAAVMAVVLVGTWVLSPAPVSRPASHIAQRDPLDVLLGGTMLWPSAGAAQEPKSEAPRPKYPLILSDSLDPSRLTPGVWTYRSETTTDEVFTDSSGGDRFRLTRATYAGRLAWIVNTARRFRTQAWTQYEDTTYLDAASLRPVRAVASGSKGRIRFEQTFSADSGHESIDRTGPMMKSWRGAIAFPFGSNAVFLNDWSPNRLSVLSPALAITRGWRGSLYQVAFISWGWARSVAPLDLKVVGTDSVTVPAGTFDCWRVEVEMHLWASERMSVWISRDKGWVVKQQQRTSDYVVNRLLESYELGT